jgi:putative ABC transport system permease protein
MKVSDMLSLSTRTFKTRPMRTFLTVLGVGVGIGTVLFLVSLGYGLQHIILSRIATADSLLTLDVAAGPSVEYFLTPANLEKLGQTPHIAEISRLKNLSAQVTMGELTGTTQVSAIDHSFFRLKGISAMKGELYKPDDKYGAVISSAAAKLFNLEPEKILGSTMKITLLVPEIQESGAETVRTIERSDIYTVTGVIDDESLSTLYLPLQGLEDVGIASFDQLKVKVESNDFIALTRDAVLQQGFIVSALSDTIDQANKIFRIVQIVLALFGFVALIVSAIGMFNTMTITLLERTNEIGIMRSIGIARNDVQKLFIVESMLMGFLGGLFGVLMGVLGGYIANFGINILATRFGGQAMDLFLVPAWFVAVIMIFSTIIGLVTGFYPAYRASRLNPLDALRYK